MERSADEEVELEVGKLLSTSHSLIHSYQMFANIS